MKPIDSKRNLVDYFKKNLKKGYTIDSLKKALLYQEYSRIAIERAIEQLNKELAQEAPVLKEEPIIKYEIIDENDNPIKIKKSFWKKIMGF